MKQKKICDVTWVGMLINYKDYTSKELEIINEMLKESNIHMIELTDIEYKNYWIYINQILKGNIL